MGSQVAMDAAPIFQVRAVGSYEQQPGCPEHVTQSISAERLQRLCRGECYHPSDKRRRITRIEVIRIRPQTRKGEPVRPLIEDPWRRLECPPDPAGCVVEFDDPEFVSGEREFIYYARAIQEPSSAVNSGNLRCTYNDEGECVAVRPCFGDYRTPYDEDCLVENEERAWSSPIYAGFKPAT